ncbi:MAG: endolytic transglycosylase MltG [Candidatus Terrybacteria bacterium]|nr:endolytic transglycosylase MltG [Candidatus Terrybacteria bacterium]
MKKITIVLSFLVFFALIGSGLFFRYLKKLDQFPLLQVKVIIPEGYTVKDIAEKFNRFDNFNKENFLKIAREGYLFPDTYFLGGSENEKEIIEKMENNFKAKIGEIKKEILTMASIIEKEAHDKEDRRIISGILWKRLNDGMLLQVDVELDTYENKGLPPMPICNPGLDAVDAALNPVDSKYWYYLSDKNGVTHYAETFEKHKLNRVRYGI